MIDGLGHGPQAALVATAAVEYLSTSPLADPAALLRGCHYHLQGTRGAAIGLAQLEPMAQRGRYCGVGNIEARLVGQTQMRLISYNGIVGSHLPSFRVFEFAFAIGDMLIVHSDGVSARFHVPDLPKSEGAQAIAEAILYHWSRPRDDATVVTVIHRGG